MDVQAATEALQAVERLFLQVKKDRDNVDETVFKKCVDTLENLRSIKAALEGSEKQLSSLDIEESDLQELRQLTLMHIPASITDAVRQKFRKLLFSAFEGEDVEIVYAALITCPWYACTQQERGEQAKHNQLFVVFQSEMERYVSPVNAHVIDQTNVVDKNWLYASELFHFVQFLAKGRTRSVEALYCPDTAVLYQTSKWWELQDLLHWDKVTGLKGFLEACKGQSVGGIGKKGKDGKFRMKDATTFRELCDSFRLMHHAYNSLKSLPPCTGEFEALESTPAVAHKAASLLKSMYQNPDVSKKDAFSVLCEWNEEVLAIKPESTVKPEEVTSILGKWHMEMRLKGRKLHPLCCPKDDQSKLLMLMEEIGGPVAKFKPEQILLITQAGSFMYGLSTPTSDVDFVVVYAEDTETVLTSCKRLPEIVESRGPTKQVEYGAYEVRCFSEMLLKGSVVMLELVYKDDHNYMSPAWKALTSSKQMFVTERGLQQYMGLIKNNFKMIQSGKHKDQPQERKLFYQIYHKMDSLGYFLQGVPPPVYCRGPIRDFILRIRTAPLQGDLHRDMLYKDAMTKFDKLQQDLSNRRSRLKENCDLDYLVDWILTVRGIENHR